MELGRVAWCWVGLKLRGEDLECRVGRWGARDGGLWSGEGGILGGLAGGLIGTLVSRGGLKVAHHVV